MIKSVVELFRLRKNVWLPESQLKSMQERKLQALISFAYERVPYYRRLFDSISLKPQHIRCLEDLREIPITTKKKLKETPIEDLLAAGVNKNRCILEKTSGSTGIPLSVYNDYPGAAFRTFGALRVLFEHGYKFFYKTVELRYEVKQKLFLQRLRIFDRDFLSIMLPIEKQVEFLKQRNPDVLVGVKSNIKALASFLLNNNISINPPKLVALDGEVLDLYSSELIKKAFGVFPINMYGLIEVGNLAWECEHHNGMHLNVDTHIIEFLDRGKPVGFDKEGMAVVTSLHSYAMPFIRYETGDFCIPAARKCACHRSFPLIESVNGRADDTIIFQDGKRVFWPFFYEIMKQYSELGQYQIIQESYDHLRIVLSIDKINWEKVVGKIKKAFEPVFPSDVHLSFERVDQIPASRSGKIRSVISKVTDD